ncbi:hypothetical protein [Streptomyces sp. V1I6]|nr:hypothetical protein [Streptomyces sp. V1I6]MDQ0847129.1 hypothetical protein [Streptomyces sp. V1I6]
MTADIRTERPSAQSEKDDRSRRAHEATLPRWDAVMSSADRP